MSFLSSKSKLRNWSQLQNPFQWDVPTMCPPPTEPHEQRCGSCQPDSSSVLSSHVPPTWLNMTNRPTQNIPRGVSCAMTPPPKKNSALSLCKRSVPSTPSHYTHPPCKNKHLLMAFMQGGYAGTLEKLWYIRKPLFFIFFNWYKDRGSNEGT